MPNHISNELNAPPEVLNFMKGETDFDFEKLLPMPAIMKDCQPHMGIIEYAKIAMGVTTINELESRHDHPGDSFKRGDYGSAARALEQSNIIRAMRQGPFPKDYSDKDFADFIACCRAIKETGCTYWYDWSSKNWGTKWNAYQTKRVSETVVTFQTAWSAPLPVLVALANRFPSHPMRLRWADEDFGSNAGNVKCIGGMAYVTRIENNSREAKELAVELLWGGVLPEYYRRTEDGDIVYMEEASVCEGEG